MNDQGAGGGVVEKGGGMMEWEAERGREVDDGVLL